MVHRGIGMTQQGLKIIAIVRKNADADTAVDVQIMFIEPHGLGNDLPDPMQYLQCLAQAAALAEDQDEFITPVAGHGIRIAQTIPQAVGHFDQQPVADPMPEAVVHELEIVEIDKGQRPPVAAPLRLAQHLLQPVLQQVAVGQAGQRVMRCLIFQLLAIVVLSGDVFNRSLIVQRLTVRARYGMGVLGDPDATAVAAVNFGLEIIDPVVLPNQRLEFVTPRRIEEKT